MTDSPSDRLRELRQHLASGTRMPRKEAPKTDPSTLRLPERLQSILSELAASDEHDRRSKRLLVFLRRLDEDLRELEQ
jgi:hypothetical protein